MTSALAGALFLHLFLGLVADKTVVSIETEIRARVQESKPQLLLISREHPQI